MAQTQTQTQTPTQPGQIIYRYGAPANGTDPTQGIPTTVIICDEDGGAVEWDARRIHLGHQWTEFNLTELAEGDVLAGNHAEARAAYLYHCSQAAKGLKDLRAKALAAAAYAALENYPTPA